jgi:hypothetical protein
MEKKYVMNGKKNILTKFYLDNLDEILPRQSRRNFTFTDVDEKLNIWFGESLTDEELNHEEVR